MSVGVSAAASAGQWHHNAIPTHCALRVTGSLKLSARAPEPGLGRPSRCTHARSDQRLTHTVTFRQNADSDILRPLEAQPSSLTSDVCAYRAGGIMIDSTQTTPLFSSAVTDQSEHRAVPNLVLGERERAEDREEASFEESSGI
eukprot:481338-Rhodomonas_salina.1